MNRYTRELENEARRAADDVIRRARFDAGKPFGRITQPEAWTCSVCNETVGAASDRLNPPLNLHPQAAVFLTLPDCRHLRELTQTAIQDAAQELRPTLAAHIIGKANTPRRFENATFDTFERVPGTEKIATYAEHWATNYTPSARGLLLVGPFGSGKTHLAVATMRSSIENGLADARMTSTSDLARKLMQGDGQRFLDYSVAEKAIDQELLVLDDIGQESPSPKIRELLFEIIDGRYAANRPTILTSNLGTRDIAERIGGATASRLTEMCAVLLLRGVPDYRLRRSA